MDYFQSNKKAWEEAFEHRQEGWGDDLAARLKSETLPFMNPMLRETMQTLSLRGKTIAQFCCNNGREILSAMQLGPKAGVGFDIANNMVEKAREAAKEAKLPCSFRACNILEIGAEYDGAFDLIFFTIGAITWFEELPALFQIVSRCLKPGGRLLLNDFHPFVNMLPLPGEEEFDPESPDRVAFSYFRAEPWLEQNSGRYMTNHLNAHTFTSFSHTMGNIVTSIVDSGLRIVSLREFDRDIGMTGAYDGKGFPLSYILQAEKPAEGRNERA
jgi:SAM-dependent methyltransferase